jgi:hypothetical protein
MTFSHSDHGLTSSAVSSRTNSRSENERSRSHDGIDNDRMSSRNYVGDGDLRRQDEAKEALLEKAMTEHHSPEPPSQIGIVWTSFWIVVNTLATIGIVGSVPLPQ